MTDDELRIAYQAARSNYEAADAGCRAEMFIKLLVAERVLSVHLGSVDTDLERLRERYAP